MIKGGATNATSLGRVDAVLGVLVEVVLEIGGPTISKRGGDATKVHQAKTVWRRLIITVARFASFLISSWWLNRENNQAIWHGTEIILGSLASYPSSIYK